MQGNQVQSLKKSALFTIDPISIKTHQRSASQKPAVAVALRLKVASIPMMATKEAPKHIPRGLIEQATPSH